MERLAFIPGPSPVGGLKGLLDLCVALNAAGAGAPRLIQAWEPSADVPGVTVTLWPPFAGILKERQAPHENTAAANQKAQDDTYAAYQADVIGRFAELGYVKFEPTALIPVAAKPVEPVVSEAEPEEPSVLAGISEAEKNAKADSKKGDK